jgi:hypothetical protein
MTMTLARPTRVAAAVLAAGAFTVLTACGTSVLDLEVGQCISSSVDGEQVSNVPVVDCAEPHSGEIYALPQLPDGEFPGDEGVTTSAQTLCADPEFQNFVGVPVTETALSVEFLLPSAETWADGDREIVCIVRDGTADTTGSLRGAAR